MLPAMTPDDLVRELEARTRELRASEARLHSLIARNSDGVVVVDSDGAIRFTNPAAEALFGRSAGVLFGSPFGFPISDGDITELEIPHRDGDFAVVEMRVVDIEWDGFPALLLSLRDVTQRKRTEQALADAVRTNYQFAAAIASMTMGVVISDPYQPDNPVIFANGGFTRMTGYTPQEIIGRNCRFLQGPDTDPEIVREIRAAIASRQAITCTLINYRKDGTPFWNELTINPVFDGEGQLMSFVGLQNDVTIRVQAEQAFLERERLMVALEKERELSHVKTLFMSTISHEFRTPLAMIQSASELLDRYYTRLTEAQRRERLDSIQSQVQHLEDMLDEISFSLNAELKRLDFHPVLLNVAAFCETIIEEVRTTVAHDHLFVFEAPDDLQDIAVDPKLLRHILLNLLTNAVKYSPARTPIEFRLLEQNGHIVFSITDHGIGIPEADLGRIFDAFFRASNVQAVGGTGLGLKVVKDCVTLHGGTIVIESEVGRGTTCVVRLPRTPVKP
jgi:PAS domain S-box-containing protein